MNALLLETGLTAEQQGYAGIVRSSGEALLTILNDILDISKLEAGKVELEAIDFNLAEIVAGVVALLAAKAREKKIDLDSTIDPGARADFRGDPTRLRQVLLNLLSNAIKFTAQGGVTISVTARAPTMAGCAARLRFEVRDTGIGMSEEVRQSLFRKFTQADSSITRRYGGTGLGLAISKQLVELMGGEIGMASEPGKGSTCSFEIELPAASAPVHQAFSLARVKGRRVLLVDDSERDLEIAAHQLRYFDLDISHCRDALDATAALEREQHRGDPYSIVFIDRMMPDMAGEMLAQRIRATPGLAQPKLVMISSADGPEDGDAGLAFDASLTKPLRHDELAATLSRLFAEEPPSTVGRKRCDAAASAALRVLVAEDNEVNRMFISAVLAKTGYAVTVVQNGLEAVEAVRERDFDVVLMDVQMPELDGIGATQQIRALPTPRARVRIIALTAHAMIGIREELLEVGMDDYLSKPIEPALLLAKLAELSLALAPG
jgi:CheY-like chemotaxis protein